MIFNNKKLILNVMAAGVMVYAILLLFSIFANMLNTAPYPNEYREAANIYMTKSIVEGKNIYSLDMLTDDNPGLVYLYGPLESIIAAFFVVLFRADIPMVHYCIAFIVMVLGASLSARMAFEHSTTYLAPAMAFLFTIYCNWRYGYIYAAPDALGLFLLILFLFVLTRKQFELKPGLAAIIAILSFFTKQYFAVIALTGFLYFLFLSKKDTIKYTVSGLLISGGLFCLINYKFPLYWTYSLYFLKGPGAGMPSGDIAGTAHNVSQVKYIGGLFFFLFLFTLMHILITVYRIIKKDIELGFDIKEMDKPLIVIKNDEHFVFEILLYLQMFVAALILYYIGNNAGAFISYYLQLFVPALIILAVVATDKIRISEKHIDNYKAILIVGINVIMCFYTVWRAAPRLYVTQMADLDKEYWESLYEVVAEYDHQEVWYNPLGEYPVITTDKYIYNTGMPMVASQKFLDKYNDSEFAKKLFPYAGKVMEKHVEYRNDVRRKVLNGEYELIMYMDEMDVLFSRDDMAGHYTRTIEIPLKSGSWTWDMVLYTKKGDENIEDYVIEIEDIDY